MKDVIKGIDFFNIRTREEVWVKRPAQIKAFIESSDMAVNRQSDVGWRLGKEWVQKLREARNDSQLMNELTRKYGGGEVTDRDLMVAVYNRERNAAKQAQKHKNSAPYEQEYLESIKPKAEKVEKPQEPKSSK